MRVVLCWCWCSPPLLPPACRLAASAAEVPDQPDRTLTSSPVPVPPPSSPSPRAPPPPPGAPNRLSSEGKLLGLPWLVEARLGIRDRAKSNDRSGGKLISFSAVLRLKCQNLYSAKDEL